MKKVSIIVPVYNAELYLKTCIDSILNQTYQNIELILVDDGSSDNSSTIYNEYLGDPRVNIIKKENGGVSSARNSGIKEATGDYIMFVDSDDYIELTMIEEYVKYMTPNQMIIGGFNEIYVNKIFRHNPYKQKITEQLEIINLIFHGVEIGGFLFNKIYDSNIIKKHNLYLNEEIHMCEDLLFNINYLFYIEKVTVMPDSLYNYRMRRSSATWSFDENLYNDLKLCLKTIEQLLESNDLLDVQFLYYKLNLLYKYSYSDKNEKKSLDYDYKVVMKSKDISIKRKVKLFLMKNMNYIYQIYMKIKIHRNKLFK